MAAVFARRICVLSVTAASIVVAAGLARAASTGPKVRTNRGCYLVGQRVLITGSGFAASRQYTVSVDGVYFGISETDQTGGFAAALRPGGLDAGVAEQVDHLDATDGTSTATAVFTVTRTAGARLLATSGSPATLQGPFQVWGFALDGRSRPVYLHYVGPSGGVRTTVMLGHTRGQCGYLQTASRLVFPFAPSPGGWTLQIDTRRNYGRDPRGPIARIGIQVG